MRRVIRSISSSCVGVSVYCILLHSYAVKKFHTVSWHTTSSLLFYRGDPTTNGFCTEVVVEGGPIRPTIPDPRRDC